MVLKANNKTDTLKFSFCSSFFMYLYFFILLQTRAIGLFPMLQKASRITAVVEFVISGNRMRLFVPKDSLMITFSLSGECETRNYSYLTFQFYSEDMYSRRHSLPQTC